MSRIIKATTAGGAHPDAATHDAMGLATDAELTTHAGTPHGGHPDLSTHDALGLATDTELTNHAGVSAASTHGNLGHSNSLDHSNANDHANTLDHTRAHDPIIAADHAVTGLTPGHVLTVLAGGASLTWAAPAGGAAADPSYSPGSFTVVTETQRIAPHRLKMTTTQRITIEGTGRLSVYN